MDRRSFLAAGSAATWLLASEGAPALAASSPMKGRQALSYFDYRGVTLRPSRFRDQMLYARDFYFNMSDDDMLKGFRRKAGLSAPGHDMKGWCKHDCSATFGQWLSGMARLSRATGDAAMRDKAIYLAREWTKTIGSDGNPRMGTYGWEKMSCGLVDLAVYADDPTALDTLARITRWARDNFDRSRSDATIVDRDGRRPKGTLEWYTLAENSLRAYGLTGEPLFRDFAMLWLYPDYWGQFEHTKQPAHAAFLHSYSHVNTFSSAAMVYAATGNPRYLAILKNAYDWVRQTQAYASGGFGPGEWTVPADGTLGSALEVRLDTAELPCGSWAGFKLARYLTGFTGEAQYGDWVETLLHNGIGAALPIQPDGRAFYYADYRVGLGTKTYFWDEWPCCSGTYIQTIADYHNIIYQQDEDGLYVSQTIPSEVTWEQGGVPAKLVLDTTYPDEDQSRLTLAIAHPRRFKLRVRVPSWCDGASFAVNGEPVRIAARPNEWAVLDREWRSGDAVTVRLPMTARLVPVDRQHPKRVAVMYGPVLLAQDARFAYPLGGEPDAVLRTLSRKEAKSLVLEVRAAGDPMLQGGQAIGDLVPFHTFKERQPYRSYFDLDEPRFL